jgi:4-alpha-glucanotransferase
MNFARAGGILLHPTSLPGPHGIGDLGPEAHRFVDWLSASGCKLWQILPLGPTGYGNSPYQCHSVFAGNPYLISPDLLVEDGLLSKSDLLDEPDWSAGPTTRGNRVDYARLIPWKTALLERAYRRAEAGKSEDWGIELARFRAGNAFWLDEFALFMALKESEGGGSWIQWPRPLRLRDPDALDRARRSLRTQANRFAFYQLLFFQQWAVLRTHANTMGIQIIGDIPIFAAEDSSDVWSRPELFCLDHEGRPSSSAGVPPDYFSPTGQLWGNPVYRWETHGSDGYAWWLERVRATLKLVDIARLDHFRGFQAFWEIPAGSPTAETGRWTPGPSDGFFDAVERQFANDASDHALPFVAEDLGEITPAVVRLRDRFRLPGMKILQFGFSDAANPFLPHNYVEHSVAYTGTHDNDTSRGWLARAPTAQRGFALNYLHASARNFAWEMMRGIWSSVANFAIAPMQDVLNLGTSARMNYPGRADGNWEWRFTEGDLDARLSEKMRGLNALYGR